MPGRTSRGHKSDSASPKGDEMLTGLFEHMPSGVAIYKTDDSGKSFIFVDLNPAAEKIDKVDKSEVIGKCIYEAFPGTDESELMEMLRRVWKSGVAEHISSAPCKDARTSGCYVESWIYKLRTGEIVEVYNDITERKRSEADVQKACDDLKVMQADLIQSEKMAAIGRFSAGIAHEVKNPLAVIVGCAELLENKMPHYDLDAMDTLEKIKDAALRANSILVSLLQYARPSELKSETVGPEELVYGVLPLFEKRAKEASVAIIKEFSPDSVRLSVDKNQMHQVIFNIIKNAIEAMPEGGRLSIKTCKMIMPELSYSNESCVIEFRDTGCGISKENITKISEPFFSTKTRVAGTGLGLFMVKSILDRHKGKLAIESELGRGTAVKVMLPILLI